MLSVIVVAAAAAALGSFTWGLRRHFRAEGSMPSGMRALTTASSAATLLFLFLVLRYGVGPRGAAVSIAASLGATALFWWAVRATKHSPPHFAHTGDTPQMLHEAGPFAYVRHPFYLSYCIFWAGTAVAAGGLQWVAAVVLVVWYFLTARAEEARFSQSPMAASYDGYRRRTGMILPRLAQVWRR